MPKQPAIPGLRDAMKKKVTRREQFLAEMDAVVPWARLQALIALHYRQVGPKGGRQRIRAREAVAWPFYAYSLNSTESAGSTYFRSYTTDEGLLNARMPSAPNALN
jgi:hypothetical protein